MDSIEDELERLLKDEWINMDRPTRQALSILGAKIDTTNAALGKLSTKMDGVASSVATAAAKQRSSFIALTGTVISTAGVVLVAVIGLF